VSPHHGLHLAVTQPDDLGGDSVNQQVGMVGPGRGGGRQPSRPTTSRWKTRYPESTGISARPPDFSCVTWG
jgi:hypothetical protein